MDLKPKAGGRKWLRGMLNVFFVLVIFGLGVAVGQGSVNLDLHKNKPVANGLPDKLDYNKLDRVYSSLKNNYDGHLTEDQLIDGLKHGLAGSAKDPYTVYFNAKEAKDFSSQLNNSFSGIGAQLGLDKEGNLEIIAPIDGLPADKAGLQSKDIVAEINGVTTSGMTVDEAVSRIRGPKGSTVKLQIVRDHAKALDFNITRDDINLPSVKSKTLDGDIGYIQITNFAPDTFDLTQQAATKFKEVGVRGIILDLRDDPGGYLDQAVKVSSLWLPEGKLVLQEKRGGEATDNYRAQGGNILEGMRTVVLINDGSASASEITAGALRDNNAAYLIGEKSYGKGVVQDVICITGQRSTDGTCPADELKVTVGSWYRPNGQNINKKGIKPDKTVKISDTDAQAGKDTQLETAQAYLRK